MKLKTKLILLAAVPLLGLVIAISAIYLSANRVEKAVRQATTENIVYASLAHDLKLQVVQVQQFLSDISATRGQDGLNDGFQQASAARDAFLGGLKSFRTMFEANKEATHLQQLTTLEQEFEVYYQHGVDMAKGYVAGGPAVGNKLMPEFDVTAKKLSTELETFVTDQSESLTTALEGVEKFSHRNALVILLVGLTLAIAAIAFTVHSIRSIIGPMQRIALQVGENASNVRTSAAELSTASQTVAEGASEQAASLEETSASLEEMSSMTKRNADNATSAAQLGKQSRESASAGLANIGELSRTLTSIKSAVAEMKSAVAETQTSSQEISKIIKTIDEIAFQTNLLALNAAVEAARAGEAGAGFAVVADEVRALAQRSAQAAKDTAEKIEIAVKRSELGTEASTKVVQSLTEVETTAQSIQQVFDGIVTQIKSLDDVIAEIAAASKEQSHGIGEVNMAVSQMDKVTQSNAAAAEENAASAATLNAQSVRLLEAVGSLSVVIDGTAECAAQTRATTIDSSGPAPVATPKSAPLHRDVAAQAMNFKAKAAPAKSAPTSAPTGTSAFTDF